MEEKNFINNFWIYKNSFFFLFLRFLLLKQHFREISWAADFNRVFAFHPKLCKPILAYDYLGKLAALYVYPGANFGYLMLFSSFVVTDFLLPSFWPEACFLGGIRVMFSFLFLALRSFVAFTGSTFFGWRRASVIASIRRRRKLSRYNYTGLADYYLCRWKRKQRLRWLRRWGNFFMRRNMAWRELRLKVSRGLVWKTSARIIARPRFFGARAFSCFFLRWRFFCLETKSVSNRLSFFWLHRTFNIFFRYRWKFAKIRIARKANVFFPRMPYVLFKRWRGSPNTGLSIAFGLRRQDLPKVSTSRFLFRSAEAISRQCKLGSSSLVRGSVSSIPIVTKLAAFSIDRFVTSLKKETQWAANSIYDFIGHASYRRGAVRSVLNCARYASWKEKEYFRLRFLTNFRYWRAMRRFGSSGWWLTSLFLRAPRRFFAVERELPMYHSFVERRLYKKFFFANSDYSVVFGARFVRPNSHFCVTRPPALRRQLDYSIRRRVAVKVWKHLRRDRRNRGRKEKWRRKRFKSRYKNLFRPWLIYRRWWRKDLRRRLYARRRKLQLLEWLPFFERQALIRRRSRRVSRYSQFFRRFRKVASRSWFRRCQGRRYIRYSFFKKLVLVARRGPHEPKLWFLSSLPPAVFRALPRRLKKKRAIRRLSRARLVKKRRLSKIFSRVCAKFKRGFSRRVVPIIPTLKFKRVLYARQRRLWRWRGLLRQLSVVRYSWLSSVRGQGPIFYSRGRRRVYRVYNRWRRRSRNMFFRFLPRRWSRVLHENRQAQQELVVLSRAARRRHARYLRRIRPRQARRRHAMYLRRIRLRKRRSRRWRRWRRLDRRWNTTRAFAVSLPVIRRKWYRRLLLFRLRFFHRRFLVQSRRSLKSPLHKLQILFRWWWRERGQRRSRRAYWNRRKLRFFKKSTFRRLFLRSRRNRRLYRDSLIRKKRKLFFRRYYKVGLQKHRKLANCFSRHWLRLTFGSDFLASAVSTYLQVSSHRVNFSRRSWQRTLATMSLFTRKFKRRCWLPARVQPRILWLRTLGLWRVFHRLLLARQGKRRLFFGFIRRFKLLFKTKFLVQCRLWLERLRKVRQAVSPRLVSGSLPAGRQLDGSAYPHFYLPAVKLGFRWYDRRPVRVSRYIVNRGLGYVQPHVLLTQRYRSVRDYETFNFLFSSSFLYNRFTKYGERLRSRLLVLSVLRYLRPYSSVHVVRYLDQFIVQGFPIYFELARLTKSNREQLFPVPVKLKFFKNFILKTFVRRFRKRRRSVSFQAALLMELWAWHVNPRFSILHEFIQLHYDIGIETRFFVHYRWRLRR